MKIHPRFRYIMKHKPTGNIEVKVYSLDQIEERPLTKLSPAFLDDYELVSRDFFTEMTDSNQKEIFAGDIVKRHFEIGQAIYDPVSLGFVDFEVEESGYFVGVVSYRPSEGFVLNNCRKFNDDDEIIAKKSGVKIYANQAVVIGNVHQHANLLEVPHEQS